MDRVNENIISSLNIGHLVQQQVKILRVRIRHIDEGRHIPRHKWGEAGKVDGIGSLRYRKSKEAFVYIIINEVDRTWHCKECSRHKAEAFGDIESPRHKRIVHDRIDRVAPLLVAHNELPQGLGACLLHRVEIVFNAGGCSEPAFIEAVGDGVPLDGAVGFGFESVEDELSYGHCGVHSFGG